MVITSFIITSRETLEAALVIGIVLAYLNRTNNNNYKKTVYYGIVFGVILSMLSAVIFTLFAGGFDGKNQAIFEGSTMLFAAVLLTTMIFWMMKQKHITREIENKVAKHVTNANFSQTYAYGLFALIVLAVLREGVETVIFFGALNYASGISLIGATLGIITAIAIGYLFFIGSRKINLKKFFNISSILLILIASGLVAHGVHEFQEAAVIPYVVKEVWNTNNVLNEKGLIGSFISGIFGYNGNPSLLEVLFYVGYLAVIYFIFRRIETWSSTKA